MNSKKIIVVLGMHRSGTSTITRSLQALGVSLGDKLHPAGFDNPKGFWEDEDVIQLNELLLRDIGSAYDRLGLTSSAFMSEPIIQEHLSRAVGILKKKIENTSLWGVKDPRISRLLPFWKKVFETLEIDIRYVISLRNPLSVAASLEKRNGFESSKSYYLWLEHVLPALNIVKNENHVIVSYDQVLSAPRDQLTRIAEALDLKVSNDELQEFEKSFIDNSLRHTAHTQDDLETAQDVPELVKRTYNFLHTAALDHIDISSPQYINSINELLQNLNEIEPALKLIAKRESSLISANEQIVSRDSSIKHITENYLSLETKLQLANKNIEELNDHIISLEQKLASAADRNIELENLIDDRAKEIINQSSLIESTIDQLKKTQEIITEQNNNLALQSSRIKAMSQEIEALKNSLTEKEKEISSLLSEINSGKEKEKLYTSLQIRKTEEMSQEIEALNNLLAKKDKEIASFLSEIEAEKEKEKSYLSLIEQKTRSELKLSEHINYLEKYSKFSSSTLEAILKSKVWRFSTSIKNLSKVKSKAHPLNHLLTKFYDFDKSFYLSQYKDVAASKISAEDHFILYGALERRKPNKNTEYGGGMVRTIEHGDHSVKEAQKNDNSIEEHDVLNNINLNPLMEKTSNNESIEIHGVESAQLNNVESELHRQHYLHDNELDPEFYLALYPDLKNAGIDPYQHYINHGRSEKRLGRMPDLIYKGNLEKLSQNKKTILVVSHEASRTGAPVLSLNIVQELIKENNVVALLLGPGPLVNEFYKAGAICIGPLELRGHPILAELMMNQLVSMCKFDFAIINSIESRVVLSSLAKNFVPTLSLIHEFASYTRPRHAFYEALFWSGEAIFSTSLTLESAQKEYPEMRNRNFHVLPQGRSLVPNDEVDEKLVEDEIKRIRHAMRPNNNGNTDSFIILGAGYVQLRKGVDLFIDCASKIAQSAVGSKCRFVWVGKGFDSENDASYSVYLADQIHRAGLEKNLTFIEETSAIDAVYEQADLLLLTSRLDPLPNVAIDAMAHGLPVVCFDKTTGIVDFLKSAKLEDSCVAKYLDTSDMASKILKLVNNKELYNTVSDASKNKSLEYFNMKKYIKEIKNIAHHVINLSNQEQLDLEEIAKSNLTDFGFLTAPDEKDKTHAEILRKYVRSWATGINKRKPFPGFNPEIYLEHKGGSELRADPFAEFLRDGQPKGPWLSPTLSLSNNKSELPQNSEVALHIHAYYPELLSEILSRLEKNQLLPDLFISTKDNSAVNHISALLESYQGKVVVIQAVKNCGRDIGPFLTAFGEKLLNYEFVGHLHTKKTADVADQTMGQTWYRFLLDNLIGSDDLTAADTILATMRSRKNIGIVFPDDPHVVSWGLNKSYAENLAHRLHLNELPKSFSFPVGTMFWARSQALKIMFNEFKSWDLYPAEPLPYDGSMLHALERLFPLVCKEAGFEVLLTYVKDVSR
ncbi:rhamnan synthesis F family protein [Pseudomonas sp.]|uniref:rhamnan synthesis F family protein n=1 Tax=Pseudomonas sp. TaxID=306 RepID=UPI00289EC707|nr:rhamnan synthesis F family protein [Pseudomonas sp.]